MPNINQLIRNWDAAAKQADNAAWEQQLSIEVGLEQCVLDFEAASNLSAVSSYAQRIWVVFRREWGVRHVAMVILGMRYHHITIEGFARMVDSVSYPDAVAELFELADKIDFSTADST